MEVRLDLACAATASGEVRGGMQPRPTLDMRPPLAPLSPEKLPVGRDDFGLRPHAPAKTLADRGMFSLRVAAVAARLVAEGELPLATAGCSLRADTSPALGRKGQKRAKREAFGEKA